MKKYHKGSTSEKDPTSETASNSKKQLSNTAIIKKKSSPKSVLDRLTTLSGNNRPLVLVVVASLSRYQASQYIKSKLMTMPKRSLTFPEAGRVDRCLVQTGQSSCQE
jgi:hypothetical protein